jgi:hypothetical protein
MDELLRKTLVTYGIDFQNAELPVTYQNARRHLQDCQHIDEAVEFAGKASAIGAYARMVHDDDLRKLAERIHLRAFRRCGELLAEIDARGRSADSGTFSQRDAAREAGLSKRQQTTAVRLARLPVGRFEDAVEQDEPASITALAAEGVNRREINGVDISAALTRQTTQDACNALRRLEWCARHGTGAAQVAQRVFEEEQSAVESKISNAQNPMEAGLLFAAEVLNQLKRLQSSGGSPA